MLLRAYAQHALRASLLQSLYASSAPPAVQALLAQQIEGSDLLLTAYDRAIRQFVNQSGTLDGAGLHTQLEADLNALPLPLLLRPLASRLLLSPASLDGLAAMLRSNGEVFGAYRAAGNGGLPIQVMEAFGGPAHVERTRDDAGMARELTSALLAHRALVADTQNLTWDGLKAAGTPLPLAASAWFVGRHAYSVLGFDGVNVRLRNPWGQHPAPDGVFTIPLSEFALAFPALTIEDPAQP